MLTMNSFLNNFKSLNVTFNKHIFSYFNFIMIIHKIIFNDIHIYLLTNLFFKYNFGILLFHLKNFTSIIAKKYN